MPNWVYNSMTVKADHINRILNPNNEVDFELVLPMPKELDVTDGSDNRIAVYYYLSHRDNLYYQAVATDPYFVKYYDEEIRFLQRIEHTSNMTISSEKYINLAKELQKLLTKYLNNLTDNDARHATEERLYAEGKTLIANIKKYGFPTWYDWRNHHWGCKWNARTEDVSFDDKTNELHLKFSTPWAPPVNWLVALCTTHHIPFHLEWLEEQGYRGIFDSDGTNLEDTELEPISMDDEEDID